MAPIGDRHHRRNHFVLVSLERQIRRHENAESRKGVIERIRNQAVRGHDSGRLTIEGWMNWRRVLDRIELSLAFSSPANSLVLGYWHGFNPGHLAFIPFATANSKFVLAGAVVSKQQIVNGQTEGDYADAEDCLSRIMPAQQKEQQCDQEQEYDRR